MNTKNPNSLLYLNKVTNKIMLLISFSFFAGFFFIELKQKINLFHPYIKQITFEILFPLTLFMSSHLFALPRLFSQQQYASFYMTTYIFGRITHICYEILQENESQFMGIAIYLISNIIYHCGEFIFVLKYHIMDLKWGSFLINHSTQYSIAFISGILEYFLSICLFNIQFKQSSFFLNSGIILSVVGHFFRLGAFYCAKSNFNHLIQTQKSQTHQLITSGVYSVTRHPSYLGFFLYSVGGQIILANPLCIIAYIIVLWRFFANRILNEEIYLVQFFGLEYCEYQKKVPTRIPFIDSYLEKQKLKYK